MQMKHSCNIGNIIKNNLIDNIVLTTDDSLDATIYVRWLERLEKPVRNNYFCYPV